MYKNHVQLNKPEYIYDATLIGKFHLQLNLRCSAKVP